MDKKIIDKVDFFRSYETLVHVLMIPKGSFKNGRFASGLEENKYFWFIETGQGIPFRIFLSEIYDVQEYTEKKEGEGKNGV